MKRSVCWMMTMAVVIITQIFATFAIGEQPPPPPLIPQVSANPSNLAADGVSTAIITAASIDEQGNPQVGANAYFYLYPEGMGNISTTYGYVAGMGWLNLTDSNGRAMATFTAGAKAGNVTVVVIINNGANLTILKLEDKIPPSVTSLFANPSEILLEEPNNVDYQHMSTKLNVTVSDPNGIAGVTINLSSINGSSAAVMDAVGGNVYSITANATGGTPGSKSFRVNATDIYGNSNTSVSLLLNVHRNGDVDGNGNIDFGDVDYLAGYLLGVPGYGAPNILASDVDGSSSIDFRDADQLAGYLLGVPGYEKLY